MNSARPFSGLAVVLAGDAEDGALTVEVAVAGNKAGVALGGQGVAVAIAVAVGVGGWGLGVAVGGGLVVPVGGAAV